MIQTGFETRIKIQDIIESQLPGFILQESPLTSTFLKQYYTSQEYQGGPIDIAENLDQYLKLDNLVPEVVNNNTYLSVGISSVDSTISVNSTKGYPQTFGLFKIDDEIITYTGITTNTFTGCVRGFSGITSYHSSSNPEELVFSTSQQNSHSTNTPVYNLSALFLKEFYKKLKYTFTPGLENIEFYSNLNIGNFIKSARSFYRSKGTKESFRILFNVLYGITPVVVNLDDLLIKPSSAEYLRRQEIVADLISGDPIKLVGQTIRKSTDPNNTYASISQVEPFDVYGKIYYKLYLFIGYNDNTSIVGTFDIPGKTKSIEKVSIGSSVISVDSTIGFPSSGTIISGINSISYTNKSVNQFYGCSGIGNTISSTDDIRSDETIFGYENGDITKLVELRITGVLSQVSELTDVHDVSEGDEISVNYLGKIVKNPSSNKTYTEIFANSWIYNTSSRYQVTIINNSSFILLDPIDKSSLKIGDSIDILLRGTQIIVSSESNIPYIGNINLTTNQVTVNNNVGFVPDVNLEYDIRKRLNKASSTIIPIEFGNNQIISDIQNLYLDNNDTYSYVASNGLPSYTITKDFIQSTISDGSSGSGSLQGYDVNSGLYSILSFSSPVPFINGDSVYYIPEFTPLPGLNSQIYYVEVLPSPNQIRLYNSRSFISSGTNYLEFGSLPMGSGYHKFILNGQYNNHISSQKLLKKFPLFENIQNGSKKITVPGKTGMLIDGVEIENYKTNEKIYYGPLDSIKILNSGSNYDVINPPNISVISSGIGSTAYIQPVVSGSIKNIFVIPQDFDLSAEVTVSITGGNGSGAAFEPIIQKKRREILFDARQNIGVNITDDTITFLSNHNLNTGDPVIYDSNGNPPLGIGSFHGSNLDQSLYLVQDSTYYVSIINSNTILLYNSQQDAFVGINTIGITNVNNTGIQKFKSGILKKTITEVKILNEGSGYTNRKLIVKPSGISTFNNTINFNNHGFNSGELIAYNYQTSPIIGLNTTNQYYISKIDNDYFKLYDAGIGGTDNTNYIRGNEVIIHGTGSGYQYFSYPPISLILSYSTTTSNVGLITATPVVRGEIIDAYLYEKGSDYGSTILNLHLKPSTKVLTGNNARLTATVIDGRIFSVNILYGGENYYSLPDITIIGQGSGAIVQPVISNGKIINAIVINPGFGYNQTNTSVIVSTTGSNAKFDCSVRSLTINNNVKYGDEIIKPSLYNLGYSISGYSAGIRTYFGDDNQNQHSPIIGWSYDGNPIYGPFGYTDPTNTSSQIKILTSGYQLNPSLVINRPPEFSNGYFVEDYTFDESGDLDQNNGRFTKTPDFPNGTYAYFATIDESTLVSKFPYFIGNTYRSNFINENSSINQSFDFNNSNLIRNTLPYKLNSKYATNDFIIESSNSIIQKSIVESVSSGSVDRFTVFSGGENYKVGDKLLFDNTGTNGYGLSAEVYSVGGVEISNIQTNIQTYENSIITWKDPDTINVKISPYHNLLDGDKIVISGLTTNLSKLNGSYTIGVKTDYSFTSKYIPSNSTSGIITDIYLSQIPSNISIGSNFIIGTEIFPVLNIFPDQNVIRTSRDISEYSYNSSSIVEFIPDSFTIKKRLPYFDSTLNNKIFFNPLETVGFGVSAGVSRSTTFTFAGVTNYPRSIPSQSIYIEDHPFTDNQPVILSIPDTYYSPFSISTSFESNKFYLPSSGISTIVYVTNKSKDTIGIKTTLNSSEVFFVSTGENSNSYLYSLESNYNQIITKVQKIQATVTTKAENNLLNNDLIELTVNPNLSVGIGTSTSVYVKYDHNTQSVLINPIHFSSSGINTSNSIITLPSHNLISGSKVLYSATDLVASGLSTGQYFVSKIDNDHIQLCQTYYDSQQTPPNIIPILSGGGSLQNITSINPQISIVKNNNLVFNLSDPSLVGYKFKLYFDKDFNNEFVSIASTSEFNFVGVGTVGVSANASATLNYDSNFPPHLYYSLEKSGSIVNSDSDVKNASQIIFLPSLYTGKYNVSGIGSTVFNISLTNIPEFLSYTQSQCTNLSYSTKSLSASGYIDRIKLIFGGVGYKKMPLFVGTSSSTGSGCYVAPISNNIGNIKNTNILNGGFEYSADKTLKPSAYISPQITIKSNNAISDISVINGGKYYIYPPDLIVVDNNTGKQVNNGYLIANLKSNTISSVTISQPPKGLSSFNNKIVSINNTNGMSINSVYTSSSGIVTCLLATPVLGFDIDSPISFSIGDKIFVQGIVNVNNEGSGYNSENYGYNFFEITNVSPITENPIQIEYSVSGLTTYAGTANVLQTSASVIKYEDYPQFKISIVPLKFNIGEILLLKNNEVITETDLKVTYGDSNSIKVFGSYNLSSGDVIVGKSSGTIATIDTIKKNYGTFDVSYSTPSNYGWSNDVGKLNKDDQVIPDNDYYQNLSYTVKSPIQFEDMITPVNSLLHTTGLKNFADVGITSEANYNMVVGITTGSIIQDIINENRVDTIYNFDEVVDYEVTNNSSNFLKFKNKKLSSYVNCVTNRVLKIDDISSQFVGQNLINSDQSLLLQLYSSQSYNRFLIQVVDSSNSLLQLTELIILNDNIGKNIFKLDKSSLYNKDTPIADFEIYTDDDENSYLQIVPTDSYNYDYNIKILENYFTNNTPGIGTTSVGFVNLISTKNSISSGLTSSIVSVSVGSTTSVYSNIQVIDNVTNAMNYVEIYLTTDGIDTYLSEYYFDSKFQNSALKNSLSYDQIGYFGSSISSGILSLNYTNTGINSVTVYSKNVGFGSTSVGIGTYRFILPGQIPGYERTAKYQSDYSTVSTASSIVTVNKLDTSSIKSLVQVSIGSTSELHQVMTIQDNNNIYTLQYPSLSIGSTLGIGTFGGVYDNSGSNFSLVFYPNNSISGEINVLAYSECLYTDIDLINSPPNLQYGSVTESISNSRYFGSNNSNIYLLDFDLNYKETPIFQKSFNPNDSAELNPVTGIITIPNHFFVTGEKLNYIPSSTFIGVGYSALGIGSTQNSSGIVTNILPADVYPIKLSNDTFRLSTRPDYAFAGIYVTFTSYGSGNRHILQMNKRNERTIICIDNIIQSPIAWTPINYTLYNNGGSVSTSSTIFALSGISSINTNDLLYVNDEYMTILSVGFGTTSSGPITYDGSIPLVNVSRGSVGSSATSHLDSTIARIYRGSYNISGDKIHFASPPHEYIIPSSNPSNLPPFHSSFDGRVFLRNDYTTNIVYDDISSEFTGIGQTYTLTTQGINTVGLSSIGDGIVLINGIFQTPTTFNNTLNDYSIIQKLSPDSTDIVFSGIKPKGSRSIIKSEYDINQNDLPRGGIIVSLGSSVGLGYAPLVGAAVSVSLGVGGTITSISAESDDLSYGSGYYGSVSIGITDSVGHGAVINASVGVGGTLIFTITNPGSGYVNPTLDIPSPSYTNLPVIGVSRLGIGNTTLTGNGLLLDVTVSESSTTGIGSTLFEINSFNIKRPGYGFQKGDVITPVGLVTAFGLSSPLSQFQLTVIDTFTDAFSAWQFGDLDYIDSISHLQNGIRSRFPLYYNGSLLSFQKDKNDPDSILIDLNAVLLIFVNGVLQDPGVSYQFSGGSSFTFTTPPLPEDNISIFFYMGSRGIDSYEVDEYETIKSGDDVQVFNISGITTTQNSRTVFDISSSDLIQTNIYYDIGIDPINYKPISWTKQKVDSYLNGQFLYKSRKSIEPLIYPTAKIIKDFSTSDTDLFVDNADFFYYEENLTNIRIISFDGLIVKGTSNPVAAAITATVSAAGTISSLHIVNPGSGYVGSSVTVKISNPVNIGIGSTATATGTVGFGGTITTLSITNPGFGYSSTNPPQVITTLPSPSYEYISKISTVQGFSGIITGISTTMGTLGNPLAINFYLNTSILNTFPSGLSTGYPIFIYNTSVGEGVISIDTNDSSIVGIGTSYLDNIYYIHNFNYDGINAVITCNINSNTPVVGIQTNGNYVGSFSWGLLSGFNRSNSPISISVSGSTVDVGLTTFASIQRKNYGILNSGALKNDLYN
jgi:hypothetical protein